MHFYTICKNSFYAYAEKHAFSARNYIFFAKSIYAVFVWTSFEANPPPNFVDP